MAQAKYSPSTGGVYPVNAFDVFPEDAVDIPDALYALFTGAEISGFSFVNGEVVAWEPPPKTPEELAAEKESVLAQFRSIREIILNRLTGIALDFKIQGDNSHDEFILATKANLLNIPQDQRVVDAIGGDDCKTYLLIAYREVADAVKNTDPILATIFNGIDA